MKSVPRDDDWLANRLADIWYKHFPDIEQPNEVIITFGRKSRTRLGSIGMPGWQDAARKVKYTGHKAVPEGTSVITITGYFKDERVPQFAVDATIGHELVHYAHGFHSPHPQLYANAHRGGIVDKELVKRGLGDVLKQQQVWLRTHWIDIVDLPKPRRKRRRSYGRMSFLPAYQRKKA